MSRLAKQVEAYRMARRIVRACNRMKAGQGVALQWCAQQRHVLQWMAQRVATGLRKRKQRTCINFLFPDGSVYTRRMIGSLERALQQVDVGMSVSIGYREGSK